MEFLDSMKRSPPSTSSRILLDIPCAVCQDHSSGKHYGVYVCDGCAGFFKRSIRSDRRYACKAQKPGNCVVDKAHRNLCRACRLSKCLSVGMNKDSVQHERGPRNSTIRRQMALLLNNQGNPHLENNFTPTTQSGVDLSIPKHMISPPLPLTSYTNPVPFRFSAFNIPDILKLAPPVFVPLVENLYPFLPSLTPSHKIYSLSARILSTIVVWAKNIPAFATLSLSDRLILLEESWKEAFIVTSAHILEPLDWKIVIDERNPKINMNEIKILDEILLEFTKLKPDIAEYGYISGLALFKTNSGDNKDNDNLKKLQDTPAVAALQEESLKVFVEYTKRTYPWDPTRSTQLIELMQKIRRVSSKTIAELFFKPKGVFSIENIITHLYITNQSMYLTDYYRECNGGMNFGYVFNEN